MRPAAASRRGHRPRRPGGRRFPRLVIGSVTTFGLTGPYADYLGGELIAYALGGYATLTGEPDREPLKSYGNLVEYQAGAQLALGIARRTSRRVRLTGRGPGRRLLGDAGGHLPPRRRRPGRLLLRPRRSSQRHPPARLPARTLLPIDDPPLRAMATCTATRTTATSTFSARSSPIPASLDPELLGLMIGYADEVDAIMDEWLADETRGDIVRARAGTSPTRSPRSANPAR